jgi:hypothetical protein
VAVEAEGAAEMAAVEEEIVAVEGEIRERSAF